MGLFFINLIISFVVESNIQTNTMNQQEKLQRIAWIKQVLQLINLERNDFEKRLGKRGTQELIDTLLDEFHHLLNN